MRMRTGWSLLLLIAALACGDDGAPGKRGADCRVSESVLVCDGGDADLRVPAGCKVATVAPGSHEIRCPEGTEDLPDGEEIPDGAILGQARPYGRPAEAGIVAAIPALQLGAETDDEGRFWLEGIPPGVWEVHLTHADRPPLVLAGVVVLGGTVDLGAHEIPYAARLIDDTGRVRDASPDGRRALIRRGIAGGLEEMVLADLETGGLLPLPADVSDCDFFDDRYLLCREAPIVGDELLVFDADEATFVGSLGTIQSYSRASGGLFVHTDAPWFQPIPPGAPVELGGSLRTAGLAYAHVVDPADAERHGIFDVERRQTEWLDHPLGTTSKLHHRTGSLAFTTSGPGGVARVGLYRPGDGTILLEAGPHVRSLSFSPSGQRLYWADDEMTRIHRVGGETTVFLRDARGFPAWSSTERLAATATLDGDTLVLDGDSGISFIAPHWSPIFSPSDKWMVTRTFSPARAVITELSGRTDEERSGNFFGFVGVDEEMLFEDDDGALRRVAHTGAEQVLGAAGRWQLSHDRMQLVAASLDGTRTRVFDFAASVERGFPLRPHDMRFAPDDSYLLVRESTTPGAPNLHFIESEADEALPIAEGVADFLVLPTGFFFEVRADGSRREGWWRWRP